jgi:acetylornithine deacetylase
MPGTDLHIDAIHLLKQLIAMPSFSKEEAGTAAILGTLLKNNGIEYTQIGNNIYARNLYFDVSKPSILLNSHHDTVKPNKEVHNGSLFAY